VLSFVVDDVDSWSVAGGMTVGFWLTWKLSERVNESVWERESTLLLAGIAPPVMGDGEKLLLREGQYCQWLGVGFMR